MEYTKDLKSFAPKEIEGSTPSSPTKLPYLDFEKSQFRKISSKEDI